MASAGRGIYPIAAIGLVLGALFLSLLGTHGIAAAAQAQGGVIGEVVGQLKHEDDETEVRELREREPQSREERFPRSWHQCEMRGRRPHSTRGNAGGGRLR